MVDVSEVDPLEPATSTPSEEWEESSSVAVGGRRDRPWVEEQGLSVRFALTSLVFAAVVMWHLADGRRGPALASGVMIPVCLWLWRLGRGRFGDEEARLRRGMKIWSAICVYGLAINVWSTGGTESPIFVLAIPFLFITSVHTGPRVAFAVAAGIVGTWLVAYGLGPVLAQSRPQAAIVFDLKLAIVGGCVIALFVGIQNYVLLEHAKHKARRRAERSERLVARLRTARDAERVTAARKAQFYAVMSHELRTPLGGLVGLIQVLDGMPLPPREREIVDHLRDSSASLRLIVDDALDLEALERGAIRLERGTVAIRAQLDEAAALFTPLAAERGVALRLEVSPEVPAALVGDPLRVKQIIANLVGNAVKFTAAGHIALTAALRAHQLELLVEDTGLGIAPERVAAIFLPFEQQDTTIARRYGGTGLGLAIVKHLVDAMGGTIEVMSVVGQGTRFRVLLPAEPVSAVESSGPHGAALRRQFGALSVLVVDDDETNRYTSRLLLEQHGLRVATAASGNEALSLLDSARFDVLFIDLDMPGMSGLELARKIGRRPPPRPQLVALTASIFAADRAAATEAGMADFLAKPLAPHRLEEVIARVVTHAVNAAPDAEGLPAADEELFDPARDALLRSMTKTPEAYDALRRQYARGLVADQEALIAAHERGVRGDIERLAHKLAGASATIGARWVEREARRLELAAREHSLGVERSALEPLAEAVTKTLRALEGK